MLMAGRDSARSKLCCYEQCLLAGAKVPLLLRKPGLMQLTHEVKHG